jgi:hypothetical protein
MMDASANVLTSQVITDNPAEAHFFSWNNDIADLLYMDTYQLDRGFGIIKEESSGKYRLIQFLMNSNTDTQKTFAATFDNNAFVESVTHWAMHSSGLYLYMVTNENKLYRLLVDVNLMNSSIENITEQVLQPNHTLSTIKFISSSGGGLNFQNFLTVGSYNQSGTAGENGRLEIFDFISGSGDLELRMHEEPTNVAGEFKLIPLSFTGFGKPVDVAYRLP